MKRIVTFFETVWATITSWTDYAFIHWVNAGMAILCNLIPSIICSVRAKAPVIGLVGKISKTSWAVSSWAWVVASPFIFFVVAEVLFIIIVSAFEALD